MRTPPATALDIKVSNSYEAMSRQAADFICKELRRNPDSMICVSAGGTPTRTYELLAGRLAREPRLFEKARFLQIDEWGGLPSNDPATCRADLEKKAPETPIPGIQTMSGIQHGFDRFARGMPSHRTVAGGQWTD